MQLGYVGTTTNLQIVLNTHKNPYLKKYLPKFSNPPKIPKFRISHSKKSFDHPCHLKSGVPPPLGCQENTFPWCLHYTDQKITHYSSAYQEIPWMLACTEMNKRGVLIAGVSYPLSPIPLPCSLPLYPLPLWPLLHSQARNDIIKKSLKIKMSS